MRYAPADHVLKVSTFRLYYYINFFIIQLHWMCIKEFREILPGKTTCRRHRTTQESGKSLASGQRQEGDPMLSNRSYHNEVAFQSKISKYALMHVTMHLCNTALAIVFTYHFTISSSALLNVDVLTQKNTVCTYLEICLLYFFGNMNCGFMELNRCRN
jgi:hypothetical protein